MERWRRPAKVLDVSEDPELVYDSPDGRTFGVPRITVDGDTTERIRLGRMCALCFEPFEQAWPEVCPFCHAAVRKGQGAFFERQYRGVEQLKGTFDVDTEIEIMRETLRRQGR